MKPSSTLLAAFLASLTLPALADVTPAALFTDHMVLQQKKPVPVWGTAAPEEDVSVRFAGQTQVTRADADGKWRVTLDPLTASATPADLVISGKNTLTVKNVLIGEVWVCSGQSNMQWTVTQAADPEKEIAAAKFPQIRMFNVERSPAMTPAANVKGAWKEASPENAGQFSAVAYYFGRHLHQTLKVPVGLINTSWGGTRIEAWTSREALEERPCAAQMLSDWDGLLKSWDAPAEAKKFEAAKAAWQAQVKKVKDENAKLAKGKTPQPLPPAPRPADDPTKTPHFPAVLYNGMVAPLIPYAIQGAIWYQGESNQQRAFQYQELLPTMINDWRTRWNSEFSFYIVQLAGFGNRKPASTEPGLADPWAELQEAQYLTAITLPKTGLAVTNDIGAEGDIHPKNKQEVGRRLALWALAQDYAQPGVVYSGPLFKNALVEGPQVRLQFDHAAGLKTRDGGEPKHFQIAGADGKWVWAQAKIQGQEVLVTSPQVPAPVGVRYAWASWAPQANLVNAAGLPASCFRTDEFVPSTLGITSPFQEVLKPTPATPAPAPAKAPAPTPAPATPAVPAPAPKPAKDKATPAK